MEVQFGPNAVDEPSLLYKLQRKIQVFYTSNSLPNRGYGLVASSSKYGIVFVAVPDGTLSVYYLNQLINKECEPQHVSVKLPEKATHISVSCDQEMLAVSGPQLLCVYKVTDFQNQNVSPSVSIKYDVNPSTFVCALQWNPCIPDNIAVAFYDGTLLVSQLCSNQIKKVQSRARCICWSPKGKQLVTGNSDGTLCQYKPDLTPAKLVPAPNPFEGAPVEALAVHWISTFQFAVVYKNASNNSRPVVAIVNTPKAGQPSCLNYDDVCYSLGTTRPWYYYLHGLAQWNIILSSSSNSMEIATLGSADGVNWHQWCQTDEARPELPLTNKKIENYPVGLCVDTCAIHQLPWGENEVLPHMPLLHVLSQSGLLTIFNVINLNKQAAQLCSPPQQLVLPVAAMISDIPNDGSFNQSQPVQPTSQPKVQQEPVAQPLTKPQVVFAVPTSQVAPTQSTAPAKPQSFQQPPTPAPEQVVKPAVVAPQPQAPTAQPAQQKPPASATATKPQPAPKAQLVNAALKAEQERINKLKVDQELRNMLIKEVNDFQVELHKFVVKSWDVQVKLQRDLDSLDVNFNFNQLDTEQLKKECSLEELRGAIIQLKLELVRACAVVAEARVHAEAKDVHQWSQTDPLTTKRVASVKQLAYYVQTQLEQAHKALDYKWDQLNRDQFNKPGQRMIRPILDDVYQPLVKQQEILSRQQAVLRSLRATLKECDGAPVFKHESLLRDTPFRNKDPLSKLTKNILNMSIDSKSNRTKEPLLTPQKLDALRDLLSNHKPVKIKPVNVELRQHLAAMRLNYQKSVKETAVEHPEPEIHQSVKPEALQPQTEPAPQTGVVRPDLTGKPIPLTVPMFMPVSKPTLDSQQGLSNVVRTLFTDEPKQDPHRAYKPPQQQVHPTLQPCTVHRAQIPKPVQPTPQSVQQTLKPVQPTSQPVQEPPKTFQPTPQPVQQTPKPVQSTPQLAQQTSKPVQPTSQPAQRTSQPTQSFGVAAPTPMTASVNTRSVLKDMLQNKQANLAAKTEGNTFMGQKICSPAAFVFSSTPPSTAQAPTVSFTSKPISDINNMFDKFTPQTSATESKPLEVFNLGNSTQATKPRSGETGEPETPEPKPSDTKNNNEKLSDLFGIKTSTPPTNNSQNVPDVLKSNTQGFTAIRADPRTQKSVENVAEKLKENSSKKLNENVSQEAQKTTNDIKENVSKPSVITTTSSVFASIAQPVVTSAPVTSDPQKSSEEKPESKAEPPKDGEKSPTGNSSASSIFAAANAATTTAPKPQSVFGAPTSPKPSAETSIFGTPISTPPASPSTDPSKKEPVFGATTTESASSIFGQAAAQSESFGKTQSGSIFSSTPATSASLFGSSTFGSATTTTQSSSSSIFGKSTSQSVFSSTPSPSSVFGTAVTTAQSVFGSSPGSVFGAAVTPSVFGSSTTSIFGSPATSQVSVFGSQTTTAQSVFGTAVTTSSSVFGTASATSQSSVFGSTATTAQSMFGTATATTQASIFGGTINSSVFGTATPSSQQSVFGGTTQASVFGSVTPSTQASVFGSPTQTTQTSVFGTPTQATHASVFGTPPQTTQAPAFGTPPATTAQSGSLFGGAESSMFSAASISTTSASSPTSGGNIFGGGSSGSVFGSGSGNVFGGKSTFGQTNTTAAAIFGGGGAASPFGQKPPTDFWTGGGNANSSSGFGSTGFGQQATTQASSIFGGGTGGSFSSPSSGQPFGSAQQTSVFASPTQAAPGFGASGFGAKPAFGQSTGFGSPSSGGGFGFGGINKSPSSGFGAPASFGGGASFGGSAFGSTSPGKMFGGAAAAPGFGAPTQSNSTFENLATQNTLTFGNLAQQTGPPAPPAPTFNTSPSFTGWRG